MENYYWVSIFCKIKKKMIKLFKVKPATKQSGTSGLTLSQFLLQQKPRGIAILPSPEIVSLSIVGQPSPHPTPPHHYFARFPWQFANTQKYSWVERDRIRVNLLARQHKTITKPCLEYGPFHPESTTLIVKDLPQNCSKQATILEMTILGKWQKSYIKIINSLEIRQKKKKPSPSK